MQHLRFSPKSPSKIDKQLERIIEYLQLNKDDAVQLKYSKPQTFVPEPDYCHFNVWCQIRSAGGTAQPGWVLAQDKQKSFAEAFFHSVWVTPDGKFFDVTPRKDLEKRLLFVKDAGRSIVLSSDQGRPAINTFDNVRLLGERIVSELREITIVMEGDFPVRHGLWPW
jgi:hypothetical protein